MLTFEIVTFLLLIVTGHVVVTEIQPSSLPAWCYQPPGDCSWYRKCLAGRFPSELDKSSYALGFGEHLCQKFSNSRNDFSESGRLWVDQTKQCLQMQLVPILDHNVSMTDPEIRTFAFRTHTVCYTDPPSGGPSFCSLPFTDWFQVAWIVKETIISEAVESTKLAGSILSSCGSKGILNLIG